MTVAAPSEDPAPVPADAVRREVDAILREQAEDGGVTDPFALAQEIERDLEAADPAVSAQEVSFRRAVAAELRRRSYRALPGGSP